MNASRLALFLCALAVGSGCAGYRVGPQTQADYHTVAVVMLGNKTLNPGLEAQVSNAIIKRLQSDSTLRVEARPDADIILTGEVTKYRRVPILFQKNDTTVPREYRIYLTVQIEARRHGTGEVVLGPTKVEGRADVFIGDDLQSADFQVLPLVADDVAKQVVGLLVDHW